MRIDTLDGSNEGDARFLVVKGVVYSSGTRGTTVTTTTHVHLGKGDGVHEEILRLRNENASLVCGGIYSLYDETLTFSCGSSGYKIPVTGSNAEQHALEAFQRIIVPGIILRLAQGSSYAKDARLMLDD